MGFQPLEKYIYTTQRGTSPYAELPRHQTGGCASRGCIPIPCQLMLPLRNVPTDILPLALSYSYTPTSAVGAAREGGGTEIGNLVCRLGEVAGALHGSAPTTLGLSSLAILELIFC